MSFFRFTAGWSDQLIRAALLFYVPEIVRVRMLLLGEDTPGQSHNFISGCCAVGSAPALGAGGPGFESPHSDQILQKNRINRRFFCILSLILWFWRLLFCGGFSGGTAVGG